jgi:hypothetical protein
VPARADRPEAYVRTSACQLARNELGEWLADGVIKYSVSKWRCTGNASRRSYPLLPGNLRAVKGKDDDAGDHECAVCVRLRSRSCCSAREPSVAD